MPRNTDQNCKPARRSLKAHLLTIEKRTFDEYEALNEKCAEIKKGRAVPDYLETLRNQAGHEWNAIYSALVDYFGTDVLGDQWL